MKKIISVDVAIIGAGTAGLTAYHECSKVTKSVRLIDHGPLGTTCARIGCMPSKSLIQAANYYHDRLKLNQRGIYDSDKIKLSIPNLLRYVRDMRDSFTKGVIDKIHEIGDNFILGKATFVEPSILKVGDSYIRASKIIIATGSQPVIPNEWAAFKKRIMTIENIFDHENFPDQMTTIGAGPIGIELSQALSRLDIDITTIHAHQFIGTLSDPVVNQYAIEILSDEFNLLTNTRAQLSLQGSDLVVKTSDTEFITKGVLAALGFKPYYTELDIQNSGINLNKNGLFDFNSSTLQIKDHPVFIVGDANQNHPVLHEAADEGAIAGYNATREKAEKFIRRTPITILFTEPNIATVGLLFHELKEQNFVTGEVLFGDQGRSKILSENKGILRVYACANDGRLLGAEMICPQGEHIAHMIAWSIQQKLTIFDMLKYPFYHPTIQEGLRTALRDSAVKINKHHSKIDEIDTLI